MNLTSKTCPIFFLKFTTGSLRNDCVKKHESFMGKDDLPCGRRTIGERTVPADLHFPSKSFPLVNTHTHIHGSTTIPIRCRGPMHRRLRLRNTRQRIILKTKKAATQSVDSLRKWRSKLQYRSGKPIKSETLLIEREIQLRD